MTKTTTSTWRHPGTNRRILLQACATFGQYDRYQLVNEDNTRIVWNLDADHLQEQLAHLIVNGFYRE